MEKLIEFEGKFYARVSSIVHQYVDFSHVPKDVLERKAALGTRVHDIIHETIEGNFPIAVGKEIGYVQSFEKWRAELNPVFVESEVRHYNEERKLTGSIDALIQLEGDDKCIIVDFKTSAQESPITWQIQGHLYHYILNSEGKNLEPVVCFIKLDKHGKLPTVFQYKINSTIMQRCFESIDQFWKNQETPGVD